MKDLQQEEAPIEGLDYLLERMENGWKITHFRKVGTPQGIGLKRIKWIVHTLDELIEYLQQEELLLNPPTLVPPSNA